MESCYKDIAGITDTALYSDLKTRSNSPNRFLSSGCPGLTSQSYYHVNFRVPSGNSVNTSLYTVNMLTVLNT